MEHLTNDLLVRHLDDELSPSELLLVEPHLTACDSCRKRFTDLRKSAAALDDFFLSFQPAYQGNERDQLSRELDARESSSSKGTRIRARRLAHRFYWAAGVAACLAAGVFFSSTIRHNQTSQIVAGRSQTGLNTFEFDGEKFWALPYSNPDLPVSTSRVVQMQVPVASLADAGIMVEPIVSRVSSPDNAVLADVLLGLDGQPVGVHVLSVD